MRKIELQFKIDGIYKSVDIDNRESFAFNLQADELTNPAAIKVPFSTSVKLPKTQLNNDIFNHIYRLDHLPNNYDPLIRTDFRLYINNNLYQSGYIKLEDVKEEFIVRLFGGLGDYFFTLKDTLLKDLDFGDELDHNVDKDQVMNSFLGKPIYNDKRKDISDKLSYTMTYQGIYDNFDNDSIDTYEKQAQGNIELRSNEVVPVKWELNGKEFKSPDLTENHRRGIAKLYLVNGKWVDYTEASERLTSGSNLQTKDIEYCGEYRSYYQKPAISMKYIFQKAIDKAKESGWNTILDSSFFTDENPYWGKLWLILNQYNTGDDTFSSNNTLDLPSINKETLEVTGGKVIYDDSELGSYKFSKGKMESFHLKTPINNTRKVNGKHLKIRIPFKTSTPVVPGKPINIKAFIPFKILATMPKDDNSPKNKPMKKNTNFRNYNDNFSLGVGLYLVYTDTTSGKVHRFPINPENNRNSEHIIFTTDNNNFSQGKLEVRRPNWEQEIRNSRVWYYNVVNTNKKIFTFKNDITIPAYLVTGEQADFAIEFCVDGNTAWKRNSHSWSTEYGARIDVNKESVELSVNQTGESQNIDKEGKMPVKAADLFRTNKTAFDLVTSYAKIFGLIFVKDESSKTITIVTRNTYFSKLETLDWTNKIARDTISIKPVPFDYKIGKFRYNNKETKYEEKYTNEFNRDYGSLNFDNGTAFTTDEKDYIDDILFDNGITVSDYSKYYLGRSAQMYRDNKTLFHFEDKDNTKVDAEYILAFKEDKPTKLNKPYLVTDDTPLMLSDGRCWNDIYFNYTDQYTKFSKTYTNGDIVYSLNFGRPKASFTADEDAYISNDNTLGDETIYSKFWKAYINDRFNKNNKVLKADFDLNLNDFNDDLFNKFISIDNTLWVINKIDKFDPTKDKLTSVELIRVEDKDNYIRQNYNSSNLRIIREGKVIYDFLGEIGTSPIVIKTDEKAQKLPITIDTKGGFKIESDLKVTPNESIKDKTDIIIDIPAGVTGTEHTLDIKWGGNNTQIIIIQASKWKVTATSNYGLAYINGIPNEAMINDDTKAIFTSSAEGYEFSHWIINDDIYTSEAVNYTINKITEAEAFWFDTERYTKVTVTDPETKIDGAVMIDNFYILEVGKEYTIVNNTNISGFQWNEEAFTLSKKRIIKKGDYELKTFNNSVLINGTITNKSDNIFDDLDYGKEVEVGESRIYTKVGDLNRKRYDNQYLIFSSKEFSKGINDINVDIYNIGWPGDRTIPMENTNKIDITVYSPIDFVLEASEGVNINTKEGNKDTEISITLNEKKGFVKQLVNNEYEYTLELSNDNIKPIGWNGEGLQIISEEVEYDIPKSKGRFYFNQYNYKLSNLTQVGEIVTEDNGTRYIDLELFYGVNKVEMERNISGSVYIGETEYKFEVKQKAAPERDFKVTITGDGEAQSDTRYDDDLELNLKVNQAENARYAVQANLAIKSNQSSESDKLSNAREIKIGRKINRFDGTEDISYTAEEMGLVDLTAYNELLKRLEAIESKPDPEALKDTGWINMMKANGGTAKDLYVRQIGNIVQITGWLVLEELQGLETFIAKIPYQIDPPSQPVYYHHNNISGDSKNTGIDCYISKGSRDVRWRKINSYFNNETLLTFTYMAN